MDQSLVVGFPVGSAVTFRSGLGYANVLPSCDGEGFVQQRPLQLDIFLRAKILFIYNKLLFIYVIKLQQIGGFFQHLAHIYVMQGNGIVVLCQLHIFEDLLLCLQ
ncbi:hypothetical protein LQD23_16975 [Chromobacterium violaceum]|nr:hypothetical protein [Chromobacterium violaceum]MCD0493976.1 hypothetical protein [Chromobacterium violaceum]